MGVILWLTLRGCDNVFDVITLDNVYTLYMRVSSDVSDDNILRRYALTIILYLICYYS